LNRWHNIPRERDLTDDEIDILTNVQTCFIHDILHDKNLRKFLSEKINKDGEFYQPGTYSISNDKEWKINLIGKTKYSDHRTSFATYKKQKRGKDLHEELMNEL